MPRKKNKMTREEKAAARAEKKKERDFREHPTLVAVKPKERYVFHSDYFEIDGGVASILSFFHSESANDAFPPFWGINRISLDLDSDVSIISFEQIRRMTQGWISGHQSLAEAVDRLNDQDANKGTRTMRQRHARVSHDLEEIAKDLIDNAAYLQCYFKLMVKAPNLEKLDKALEHIERRYQEALPTMDAAAFMGQQRKDLSTLFTKNDKKVGHPFYFTSTEFAGEYNLVTHGLEDPSGEYVGKMIGDVNNSAVLFDVDGYARNVVVANESYNDRLGRQPMADYWGSKISQSCLIHNGRVVHIVLDECDLDKLGPKMENLTYILDLNKGDVNMFEMFGKVEDELSIFAMQMQKLILMAEQAYETTDSDRSIIRNSLEKIATQFYIDKGMWYEDAKHNMAKLRVVNIPHKSVPRLQLFVAYLDQAYTAAVSSDIRDEELVHALNILRSTFRNLLSSNGDLFNTITSSAIDGCVSGRRVIYDFSRLRHRGEGVAMAQLVNIIGFACSNLGNHDTIIFHGADRIAHGVKRYITTQLESLYDKGGRSVFLYNNIDRMLGDKQFSHFEKADYTIFGSMTATQVAEYQKSLGQNIPGDLSNLVVRRDPNLAYIRRGYVNVVFRQDLLLGLGEHREVIR